MTHPRSDIAAALRPAMLRATPAVSATALMFVMITLLITEDPGRTRAS